MALITQNTKNSFSSRYLNKKLFTSMFNICSTFPMFLRVRDPNYGKNFYQIMVKIFSVYDRQMGLNWTICHVMLPMNKTL